MVSKTKLHRSTCSLIHKKPILSLQLLQMESIISYYLYHLITIIVAPIYFHFGQVAYLDEFVTIAFDGADIVAAYYLFFFALGAAVFLRNHIFSFISNHIFRYYNFQTLSTVTLNFFSSFWNFLRNFFQKK